MRRLLVTLIAAVAAMAGMAVASAPAQAHTVSSYFVNGWWSDNLYIEYGLHTGFPTGEIRAQLFEGKEQWNSAASTSEPTILHSLPEGNYGTYTNPCGISDDRVGVFWANLDSVGTSILGVTKLCKGGTSTHIFSGAIAFDSTNSWYFGTGDAPSGRFDFWSVASHEWGHVLGFWTHLTDVCPNDSSQHTMCATTYTGTERKRTLELHDKHTFDSAY